MLKEKKSEGITLMALVLTIIILLILVGVSINLVLSNNGIIIKAKDAKIIQTKVLEKEQLELAVSATKVRGSLTRENLTEELNSLIGAGKTIVEERGNLFLVTYTEKGNQYSINNNGEVEKANIILNNGIVEINNNYTPNYKLICIYTNNENIAYTFNGQVFYDITSTGYKYNNTTYAKIYGLIINENIESNNIEEIEKNTVTIETITYDYDIDGNTTINGFDVTTISTIGNGRRTLNIDMSNIARFFKSDVIKDKIINNEDSGRINDYIKTGV